MPSLKQALLPFLAHIELKEGEVLLRNELSKRFRYCTPSLLEMEQVESGGVELIY